MTDLLDIRLRIGLAKELKGNRVAILLHRNVGNRNIFDNPRLNIVQDFLGGYPKESIDYKPEAPTDTAMRFRDLRLRHLTLCNIKKYPSKVNEKLYGVSFEKDKKPVHSVFLGSNGVGKTSLYAAIEYAGMRKMNTAIVRGYSRLIGQASDKHGEMEVDQSEYLLRPKTNVSESSIGLHCNQDIFLMEGDHIIAKDKEKLVCDAFFCSAYDVEQLERCKDFTSFFVNQTGLSDYYSCLQTLYYLYRYITEFDNKEEYPFIDLLTPAKQEAITRLQFGLSLGAINVAIDGFAYTVYLDDIVNFNFSGRSSPELMKIIDEACLKLRYEVESLPSSSWFTFPTKQEYGNIIQTLVSLKSELKNGQPNSISEKIQYIKEFNSFRTELKKRIKGTLVSLENSVSAESKRMLIDSLMSELNRLTIQKKVEASEQFKNIPFSAEEKDSFVNELSVVIEYLEKHLAELVRAKEKKIKESIETLLSESFALDNDKVEIDISFNAFKERTQISKEQNKEQFEEEYIVKDVHRFINFAVKILSSRGDLNTESRIEVNPRSYLNTFRYKLFCVALKLVFLCISKDAYKINFPFVIDDVFDSSDFDSRLKLHDFMKDMIEMHNVLLPEEKYALQLIFFTQDDLIANQVYKGLISNAEKKNVKFSQIFDYHECDDKDVIKMTFTNKRTDNPTGNDETVDNSDESPSQTDTLQYISVEDIIE